MKTIMEGNFKDKLKNKMDQFVHEIFKLCKSFPRKETYITVSQIKRVALSIALNYIEGFARFKKGNQLNFLEIAYGSLKETKYLLYFSLKENFLTPAHYQSAITHIDEIGAMLWTEISALQKSIGE